MMSPELGFYGTNGITGASVAFAAGLALNAKLTNKDRVVAAFFGDGASNQGIVHETLNLAALWKLPLIAICETNGYAMSTPTATGVSTGSVAKRAEGYGIPDKLKTAAALWKTVRESTREKVYTNELLIEYMEDNNGI